MIVGIVNKVSKNPIPPRTHGHRDAIAIHCRYITFVSKMPSILPMPSGVTLRLRCELLEFSKTWFFYKKYFSGYLNFFLASLLHPTCMSRYVTYEK